MNIPDSIESSLFNASKAFSSSFFSEMSELIYRISLGTFLRQLLNVLLLLLPFPDHILQNIFIFLFV